MFDDQQQSDQTQDNSQQPSFGLGSNPSTTSFTNDAPVADVVQPEEHQQEPQVVDTTPQEILPEHAQPVVTDTPAPAPATGSSNLDDIKQQALAQLSPLVNQLEQSAEEKYKTLMMMIQASDNEALLAEAYQAAQGIENEKIRAEALLNIVNEINYFTQQKAGQ